MSRGKYEGDADRCVDQREKREECGEARDNVMKNRQQIKPFNIAIHGV